MVERLVGKWQSVSAENMEAYWNALGIPEDIRLFARDQKTEMTIAKDGDTWKLTNLAGGRSRVVAFPLGKEVETTTLMGNAIKATFTVEDGQLVERQQTPAGEIIIKRSFEGGNLKSTMTAKGVTATVTFSKV